MVRLFRIRFEIKVFIFGAAAAALGWLYPVEGQAQEGVSIPEIVPAGDGEQNVNGIHGQGGEKSRDSGVLLRGHAKLYLSVYKADDVTSRAADIPKSFVDEATDFRLIAQRKGERASGEVQVQFDTLSSQFSRSAQVRSPARPLSISRSALPNDDLRLFDLSADPDHDGPVISVLHVDRANFAYGDSTAGITVGRQTISWGNGIVFSVLDLISPFTPTAIDREYKPGDDGLFARTTVGDNKDIETYGIIRRDIDDGEVSWDSSVLAAKGRLRLNEGEHSYSIETAGASRYGDGFAGVGFSGDAAGFVTRFDGTTMWIDGSTYCSGLINLDRGFIIDEQNWYAFLEYYRSGLGRNEQQAKESFEPLVEGLRRGDLFVTKNDYLAPGFRVELSPRNQFQTTVILNLNDGSGLLQPQYQFLYLDNLEFTIQGTIPFGGRGDEFGGIALGGNGLPDETAHLPLAATLLVSGYF
jgi:hypothetical protein